MQQNDERLIMGMASRYFTNETLTTRQVLSKMVLLAIAGAYSGVGIAQPATVTLNIQLDKPVHAVSPRLYGLMTEEINYSYDGGLHAEMVRNRTLQDHGFGGVAHWNIEHLGNSTASIAIDRTEGPSAALQHSLEIDVSRPTRPIGRGYGTKAIGEWPCGPILPTKDRSTLKPTPLT